MLAERRADYSSVPSETNVRPKMENFKTLKKMTSSTISALPKSFLIIIIILFLLAGSAQVTQLFDQGHNFYSKWNPIQEIPANHSRKDSTLSPDQISLYNQSEPAPMGIVDYGIGPKGRPYQYNTTAFLGIVNVYNLNTYNSSFLLSSEMSFQLNVNLVFTNGNSSYTYWIQDVAIVHTSDNFVYFVDNIWNFSSPSASMLSSTVDGYGTISDYGNTAFYVCKAGLLSSGNNVFLSYPYEIELMVNTSINFLDRPVVYFSYNDGFGWVEYDEVDFIFASALTDHPEFSVNGFSYNPYGTYYDAELIMGGPGNGRQTTITSSSTYLQLEYWNGNNYQMVDNAYNFGSDTAEGISNALVIPSYNGNDGNLSAFVLAGNGTLGKLYSSDEVSDVELQTNLPSGTLIIGNSSYRFLDGNINVTLSPSYTGFYQVDIYDSSGQLLLSEGISAKPGEFLRIPITLYSGFSVEFSESGLPSGSAWYVNLSNGQDFSSYSDYIIFYEPNGSYSFNVNSNNKDYYTYPYGSFVVDGNYNWVQLIFKLQTYLVEFIENGLPPGTIWSVTLNGTSIYSNDSIIYFNLPDGNYNYTAEPFMYINSARYVSESRPGILTVNGSNVDINITYARQYYVNFVIDPSVGGYIAESSGWYNTSSTVFIRAIPYQGYLFSSWIGTGNGSYSGVSNPASITINGPITEEANFIKIYQVTFVETGLPSGTTWYLNLSDGGSFSSRSNTIVINLPNGSYSYDTSTTSKEYEPSQPIGTFTVSGTNFELSIRFNIVTYPVTFTESGLSPGTSWSVKLNGLTETSTNATLTFNEPNGTYSYVISGISGYRTNAYSGIINVNGNPVSISTIWTTVTYPITISENGIPTGTSWSATLTGTTFNGQYINVTLSSTTNTITFNEPNGTYSYTIHLPSGYQSNNAKEPINVSGNSETVTFTAQRTMNYLLIGIIAVIVIILVALGVIFLMRSKNKQKVMKQKEPPKES